MIAANTNEFTRPDRQQPFNGIPHWDWPKPVHDRETITVDRISADIDGPAHRFTIKRGDTVEVFFSKDKVDLGEVVGISHANDQVGVLFANSKKAIWFSKGQIYPAVEVRRHDQAHRLPLSQVLEDTSPKPEGGFTDLDRVPTSIEFDQFREFHSSLIGGKAAYDEYRHTFERLLVSKDSFPEELKSRFNAKQLKSLAVCFGCLDAWRNTKDQNARAIYLRALTSFSLDNVVSYSMGTTLETAIALKVRAVTEADFQAHLDQRAATEAKTKQSLERPETLADFRLFIRDRGFDALSDELLAKYDLLVAQQNRETRASQVAETVARIEVEGFALTIKEGFHDKRQSPLWIVQLSDRVERAAFNELKIKAKMLGGWYSSFKKADAGFQFLAKESAEKFAALLEGDVDRSDELQARKSRKEQTAAERLSELAGDLRSKAEEALEADQTKLKNTTRRAEMAAGMRGRAYADIALAATIDSIAESLASGEASLLDGLRHKTHVELLHYLLRRAKANQIEHLIQQAATQGNAMSYQQQEELEQQPHGEAELRFATYPYPNIYKRHLDEVILACQNQKGSMLSAKRMAKRIAKAGDFVTFKHHRDIGELTDFLTRAKSGGYDTAWLERDLADYKRLQAANIHDIHELRAALREFLPHAASRRSDNPVTKAEDELRGRKLPGFFPTPKPVIEQMLDLANIQPGQHVLEPSCGKGDILDLVAERFPENPITGVELNRSLSAVLAAKGYQVEFRDFLQFDGEYDRILMNPPFENGQDIEHVRHAFSLLAPNGKLVAVMSEGPFFRSDANAEDFRTWIDELGGFSEQLPETAFQGVQAFRQTGVRTRLLMLDRED